VPAAADRRHGVQITHARTAAGRVEALSQPAFGEPVVVDRGDGDLLLADNRFEHLGQVPVHLRQLEPRA